MLIKQLYIILNYISINLFCWKTNSFSEILILKAQQPRTFFVCQITQLLHFLYLYLADRSIYSLVAIKTIKNNYSIRSLNSREKDTSISTFSIGFRKCCCSLKLNLKDLFLGWACQSFGLIYIYRVFCVLKKRMRETVANILQITASS